VHELYGNDLDADLEARLRAATTLLGAARLRVVVTPDGAADITTAPAGAPAPLVLRPIVVPGGLGAHKWADRAPVAAFESPGVAALIVDADGTVLEASSANVWALLDGVLLTPPTDGRILPGVTRSRLLALLDAREEIVSLQRLTDADEVFLSGSVRGVEPVAVCRRARVWEPGPVTRSAADELRRHWEVER
jgi:para-aminobenzoate synthetase / 4-amino-4-deoxychorismate lyase